MTSAIKSLPLLFIMLVGSTMPAQTPLQLQIKVTQPTCTAICDGLVDLTVTGGKPGYKYAWSNGLTSEDYPNACAGSGSVTVTDAAGNTASTPFKVMEPDPIGIDNLKVKQPTPGLSNGSIEINVTGGQLPYRFSIDGINFSTANAFNNLAPGLYVIAIRDSRGCLVQSSTIELAALTNFKELNSAYHITRNEETNVMHMYSNIALSMELMDLQGRVLSQEGLSKSHDIQLSDIDYGVYFLRISDGVRSSYEKIVKEKRLGGR
jgi:hypothetical protein